MRLQELGVSWLHWKPFGAEFQQSSMVDSPSEQKHAGVNLC